MKLPLSIEGDTTIVDADGEFVADCHDAESSFGTQREYDLAAAIVSACNRSTAAKESSTL
jgi:hypothetical protein